MIGWARSSVQDYPVYGDIRTDGVGRFAFTGVFPGRYYLVSDISEINETLNLPLPKTYYPGVYSWRRATPLLVEEGRSIDNVVFQLPDFGKKRRVEIQVMSEDTVPVPGVVVQDSGLGGPAAFNEKATYFGGKRTTDMHGKVAFDVWPVSDYRLVAYLFSPKQWYSCDVFDVPSGASPFRKVVTLKGFRLKVLPQ